MLTHDALLNGTGASLHIGPRITFRVYVGRLQEIGPPGGRTTSRPIAASATASSIRTIGGRSARRLPMGPTSSADSIRRTLLSQPWRLGKPVASRRLRCSLGYWSRWMGHDAPSGASVRCRPGESVRERAGADPRRGRSGCETTTSRRQPTPSAGSRIWFRHCRIWGSACGAVSSTVQPPRRSSVGRRRACRPDRDVDAHGRGGLGRWLYGSVADEVLRHTTLPIVLITAACERRWRIEGPVPAARAAGRLPACRGGARGCGEVGDALNAELMLLRVVEPADGFATLGTSYLPAQSQGELDDAQAYLDDVSASSGHALAEEAARGASRPRPASKDRRGRPRQGRRPHRSCPHTHPRTGAADDGECRDVVLHRAATPTLLLRTADAHRSVAGAGDRARLRRARRRGIQPGCGPVRRLGGG